MPDDTELEQLKEELRRERAQSRIIFDAVPAMIWVKDTKNKILRCNKTAAEAKGMTVEEIEGKFAYEIDPKVDAAHYHADDLQVINSGQPKLGIVEVLMTASGETRWMRTDKYPNRDTEGSITGVVVLAVDVTERMRAEEALKEVRIRLEQQTQEMEHVNELFRSTLEHSERVEELFRATLEHMTESVGSGATDEELLSYLKQAKEKFDQLKGAV